MKIELNIEKKYFFGLLALGLIVLGIVGVIAYGTISPSTFGHSTGEINWNGDIPKLCLGGTCITSWTGLGSGNASSENFSVTGVVSADKGFVINNSVKIFSVNGTGAICPSGSFALMKRYAANTCGITGYCQYQGKIGGLAGCTSRAGWVDSASAGCTYYTVQSITTGTPPFTATITDCMPASCSSSVVEVLCVGSA